MFELNEALAADIAFAMENQNDDALIDMESGRIAVPGRDQDFPEDDEEPGPASRWASLPAWSSADGFRLMERFTASLNDEEARASLTAALSARKGVFRAFKEALAGFPSVQARFYHYKDTEMLKIIQRWYRELKTERSPAPGAADGEGREWEAFAEDLSICTIVEIGIDRALRLLDALLPLDRSEQDSADKAFSVLLYADCSARVEAAEAAGRGIFLEARIPQAEFPAQDVASPSGTMDSLGLLLGESIHLPAGHRGLSVFFLQAFPDYRDAGIEKRLLARAKAFCQGPLLIWKHDSHLLVEAENP
jgi:hypothetical protein